MHSQHWEGRKKDDTRSDRARPGGPGDRRAAFTFWGFRFFLLLLPVWGFVFGFIVGNDAITYLFGNSFPFMATATGWVAGFVVGLLFAVLAYLYYWFAVVWIGATAGYALGIGVMAWLTPNADIVTFIVGLALAAIFAAIFIVLRLPSSWQLHSRRSAAPSQ